MIPILSSILDATKSQPEQLAKALAEALKNFQPAVIQVEKADNPALSHDLSQMGQVGTAPEIEVIPRLNTAAETVRAFLESNPDALNWTVREIEKATGVGKSTVQRVKSSMLPKT